MPILVISTRQGYTHEVPVRDFHDAERELAHFKNVHLSGSRDSIVDVSVIGPSGSILARSFGGRLEDF